MAKLIFNNFLRGFPPYGAIAGANNNGGYATPDYCAYDTNGINPFRYLNTICPRPQHTAATNVNKITDTPRNIAVRNIAGGEAYMIGSGGKLYKVTGAVFSTIVDNSPSTPTFPHTIASASNGYDLAYVTLAGTDYLIYTHDDGASSNPARKVGIFDFSTNWTSANTSADAWSTLSTGTDEIPSFLPIVQGLDGNIYIGSGYRLDRIDITQASSAAFTAAVKSIPRNYTITTLAPFRNYLAIGAVTKQAALTTGGFGDRSVVFFWDYASALFTDIIYIEDFYIGSLYVWGRDLYAFTGYREGFSKLRVFNGKSFDTVVEFLGAPPTHNNPATYKDMMIWTANSRLNCFGSPNASLPRGYHILDSNVGGFARSLVGSLGGTYEYYTASSGQFDKVQGTTGGTGTWYSQYIELPPKSIIRAVKVFTKPLASGATATIKLGTNWSDTPVALKQDSGVMSYALDGAKTKKVFTQTIPDVDAVQVMVDFTDNATNPLIINRIEIEYDSSKLD